MGIQEQYPAYGGRGPEALRLGIALMVTATIFILMRVYVRLRVNKFGTTPLLWALAAWIVATISQNMAVAAVLHGLGNHIDIIKENGISVMSKFLFYTWLTVFFFNIAIPLGKVAAASFLMEINGRTNPKIRLSLIIISVLNLVVNIPHAVIVWVQCDPVDALWDPLRHDQHCNLTYNVYTNYVVGSVAALTDFYLAMVPAYLLKPLQIDKKLKVVLGLLMGCGMVAGVAAIIRTWAAQYILSEDSSYDVGILFRWGEVEEWLVLICSSIPCVWPLFRPYCRRFLDSAPRTPNRGGRYAGLSGGPAAPGGTPNSQPVMVMPKRHAGLTLGETQKSRISRLPDLPKTSEDGRMLWPKNNADAELGKNTREIDDYLELAEMSSVAASSRDTMIGRYR